MNKIPMGVSIAKWRTKMMICASMVTLISMSACIRKRGDTHYYVETEEFTLKVDGKRLSSQKEADAFPKDTMCNPNDTLRLHDDVTSVALCIEILSTGWYRWSEPYHGKGDYVLSLEMIHHPKSDHEANYSAALALLRDWGFINTDTIHWKDITVVRQETMPHDYRGENFSSYGSTPYNIYIPETLLADTVGGNTTLRTWIEDWMDAIFATDDELFSFLATHGYDTVSTGTHTQIYPHAKSAYKDLFAGIL